MFWCSLCDSNFVEPKVYLQHLSFVHQVLSEFKCGAENCLRPFGSINSLRKHINSKHPLLYHTPENEVPRPGASGQQSVNAASSYIDENKDFIVNDREAVQEFSDDDLLNDELIDDQVLEKNPFDDQTVTKTACTVDKFVLFASKLYSYADVSRSRTKSIINDTILLLKSSLDDIKREVTENLKCADVDCDIIKKIEMIIEKKKSSTDIIASEWRCFQQFQSLDTYIPPVEYLLGERLEFLMKNDTWTGDFVTVKAQFIPVRQILQRFFEIPTVFDETIRYIQTLREDRNIISNIVQGRLWTQVLENNPDKIILPLFIYFDDYENNNPLGSHRGLSKCGAVYLSVPCLPEHMASKLCNIFLFILFNTLDRKVFSNAIVFSKVVDELNFLQTHGITLNINGTSTQVFFKLALILGDNLGLNSMLGFTESFNSASFCRFCKIKKHDIQSVFCEDAHLLRNPENYASDLLKHDEKSTGIVEECIFHRISDVHATTNLCVDMMHDILEGACQYDLGYILSKFISDKLITLEELNVRIKGFNYGEIKNKPVEILDSHIKNCHLSMSASEMLTLIRHLPLILGHLIPHDHAAWELLIQLHRLVMLIINPHLPSDTAEILRVKIKEYLETLTTLNPGSLKPKHHLLTHYPRVFEFSGPFSKMSTFRFESKHRESKITSSVSISRKNICRTLALKHQLRLSHRFLTQDVIDSNNLELPVENNMYLNELTDIHFFIHLLDSSITTTQMVTTVEKIYFQGERLKLGSIIMIPDEEGPVFYRIMHLIVINPEDFIVVSQKLSDVYFDNHLQSYEIVTNQYSWDILSSVNLNGFTVTHSVRTSTGSTMIIQNWY